MRVLVVDYITQGLITKLSEYSEPCEAYELSINEAVHIYPNCEIIIMRSRCELSADIIDLLPNLKLVIRAGSGTDNIDKIKLAEKSITLMSVPSVNSNSVAELGLAAILSLARNLWSAHESVISGKWEKNKLIGQTIDGSEILLIGAGNIGSKLGDKLSHLGANVTYLVNKKRDCKGYITDIREANPNTDIISVQIPLSEHSSGMINTEFLSFLRQPAILVNLARYQVVDMANVSSLFSNNLISKMFIDPIPDASIAANFKNLPIYYSPHIGGQTKESLNVIEGKVLEIFHGYLRGNKNG